MMDRGGSDASTAARQLTVCVYCASSADVSPRLRDVAARTGSGIADRGWRLVYGGGGIGLMGEIARGAMDAGGHVVGVIPERLIDREKASPALSELRVVDTMRQRKHLMDSLADAFLILPGGIGTLEEFMEILTLRHLGYHERPIVLLDPEDFWAPLSRLFTDMVFHRLASAAILDLFVTTSSVHDALGTLADLATPTRHRIADWDAALGS